MNLKELFNAVLEGKILQTQDSFGAWQDNYDQRISLCILATQFNDPVQMAKIRIKPEPKPDVVYYDFIRKGCQPNDKPFNLAEAKKAASAWKHSGGAFVVKVVEDGETGQIKSCEVMK